MAFGGFDGGPQRPMADINTTPLVDVMLVLLIIFIITAPLVTQVLPVNLPKANAQKPLENQEIITLSIEADGALLWQSERLNDEAARLKMRQAGQLSVVPPIKLQADQSLPYQRLAEVMSMLQSSGLTKIGFVTQPGAVPQAVPVTTQ